MPDQYGNCGTCGVRPGREHQDWCWTDRGEPYPWDQHRLPAAENPVVVEQAVRLYNAGFATMDIGNRLGLSSPTITAVLRRSGVLLREPGGVSPIERRARREGWEPWQRDAMNRWRLGWRLDTIADHLNRDEADVRAFLDAQGVLV